MKAFRKTNKDIRHKKKSIRKSFLISNFKEYAMLGKSFSFLLAFCQKDLIWGSNVSLLTITIPSMVI